MEAEDSYIGTGESRWLDILYLQSPFDEDLIGIYGHFIHVRFTPLSSALRAVFSLLQSLSTHLKALI